MSELEQYRRNLQKLREKAALYGMAVPIDLQNEIEFHERKIQELESRPLARPMSRWAIIREIHKSHPVQFQLFQAIVYYVLSMAYMYYFSDSTSFVYYGFNLIKNSFDLLMLVLATVMLIRIGILLVLAIVKGKR
jgi:hypothetical protein